MDKELLNRFYGRYQKEIYLYLYSLCRNRQQAEDLLQETFLKALLSLHDSHGNVRAWLYLVARNLFLDAKRKERLSVPLEDCEGLLPAGEQEPVEAMIAEENRRKLYRALEKLGERKREILEMQYFGELSQKEIAAVLRITPENVRVFAYRARRELRKLLETEKDKDKEGLAHPLRMGIRDTKAAKSGETTQKGEQA